MPAHGGAGPARFGPVDLEGVQRRRAAPGRCPGREARARGRDGDQPGAATAANPAAKNAAKGVLVTTSWWARPAGTSRPATAAVIEQHGLILALHDCLPVCVFGDPLQNIFGFGDNDTPMAGASACFAQPAGDGSVVAIAQWPHECAAVASKTNGSYGIMEELEGNFMRTFAAIVDGGNPRQIAPATLKFAKDCISKIAAQLDAAIVRKLRDGKPVAHLAHPGAEKQLALLADVSPARVRETLEAIGQLPGGGFTGVRPGATCSRHCASWRLAAI